MLTTLYFQLIHRILSDILVNIRSTAFRYTGGHWDVRDIDKQVTASMSSYNRGGGEEDVRPKER